jgi:hypothetical protein
MATAFEEQVTLPSSSSLAFEDRVALLVEREAAHRDGRRLTRLLRERHDSRFKALQGPPRGSNHGIANRSWNSDCGTTTGLVVEQIIARALMHVARAVLIR